MKTPFWSREVSRNQSDELTTFSVNEFDIDFHIDAFKIQSFLFVSKPSALGPGIINTRANRDAELMTTQCNPWSGSDAVDWPRPLPLSVNAECLGGCGANHTPSRHVFGFTRMDQGPTARLPRPPRPPAHPHQFLTVLHFLACIILICLPVSGHLFPPMAITAHVRIRLNSRSIRIRIAPYLRTEMTSAVCLAFDKPLCCSQSRAPGSEPRSRMAARQFDNMYIFAVCDLAGGSASNGRQADQYIPKLVISAIDAIPLFNCSKAWLALRDPQSWRTSPNTSPNTTREDGTRHKARAFFSIQPLLPCHRFFTMAISTEQIQL